MKSNINAAINFLNEYRVNEIRDIEMNKEDTNKIARELFIALSNDKRVSNKTKVSILKKLKVIIKATNL